MLPKRCEGKNLLPYLRGERTGDAHEELYWHNVDPEDAPRRNLRAMRWKQWRLIKYPDGWRLFDLKADPKETRDLAQVRPDVVASMRREGRTRRPYARGVGLGHGSQGGEVEGAEEYEEQKERRIIRNRAQD